MDTGAGLILDGNQSGTGRRLPGAVEAMALEQAQHAIGRDLTDTRNGLEPLPFLFQTGMLVVVIANGLFQALALLLQGREASVQGLQHRHRRLSNHGLFQAILLPL